MARGGRCPACDEKLVGAARFCAACGSPVDGDSLTVTAAGDASDPSVGEPLVRDRSRWPVLVGVLVVAALAAALALSRIDDDTTSAAEPPSTSAATTTTTTEPPASTTTTQAPTTTVDPGFVDVSAVPDDLTDTVLILIGSGGELSALDLGTGEVVRFESPFGLRGEDQITSTPGAVIAQRWTAEPTTTVLDWGFREVATLAESGSFQTAGDAIWTLEWAGSIRLHRLESSGSLAEVRGFDGWVNLVGTIDGDALIANGWSGATYRVAPDGSTSRVSDALAVTGGRDWMLAVDCDEELICTSELVDFRSGRSTPIELSGDNLSLQPSDLSWDGRRGLLAVWGSDGPDVLLVVDADALTITPTVEGTAQFFGPGDGDHDRELRYLFRPGGGPRIVALDTGDEVELEVEGSVREILVAPPGWEPPVATSG